MTFGTNSFSIPNPVLDWELWLDGADTYSAYGYNAD
jgi:hypothetical protein